MPHRHFRRLDRFINALALTALGCVAAGLHAAESAVLTPDPAAWTVMGATARAAPTREQTWSRDGRAALDYRYAVGKGQLSLLVLPLTGPALAKAGGLTFNAKASHMTNLVIGLEEQGGGRWTLPVVLNANQWQTVRISFDDLVLSTGGDAPVDKNGVLDLDRVQRVSIVDVGAMLASASPNMVRLFGMEEGPRRLVLDDVAFTAPAGRRSGEPALDGFAMPQPPWSVFGATRAEASSAAPLTRPGLVVDYRKQGGLVMSLIRPVPVAALAGVDALELSLASRLKATLVLKLEQSNGDKFETRFDLPGNSALQTVQLKLADFKRSDDSASRNNQPDPAKASNLILLDIGGLFASKGDNRLWLQRVAAVGGQPGSARATLTQERAVAATMSVDVPGWSRWSKRVLPIYSGSFSLVGDPSVIHDGPIYRMVYNCYDPQRKGGAVCQATSPDGLAWTDLPAKGPLQGRMIETRPGKWDDTHETPYLTKYKGEYLLYFSGYRNKGGFFKSFPAFLGLAVSRDGVNFQRVGDEPIIKGTPGGYDSDAVFSPSIVEHEGQLVMLYTGYCFDTCKREPGVYLMAATSTNGRDWVKRDKPVMSKADLPKTKDGAAEAEIVKGPDGNFYLFMSLLYDQGHDIGLASAPTPYGPWDIAPDPIVRRSAGEFDDIGPIAPSVLIEGNKVRLWYHGFSKRNTIQIGYAEAPWPLRLK